MITVLVAGLVTAAAAIVTAGLRALFRDPGDRARPFRDPEVHHEEYAPKNMGLGAGSSTPGYNSHLTSPSSRMKVDSPAPADVLLAAPWRGRRADHQEAGQEDPAAAEAISPEAPPLPVTRAHLPPVTGPAMAAIAALTAPVRAHLEAAERARQAEWDAYVAETSPWADRPPLASLLSDDTIARGMQAVK